MNDALPPLSASAQNDRPDRFNFALKMGVIAALVLCGLIPLTLIRGVLSERRQRHSEAVENITSTWGQSQVFAGPVLVVPFKRHVSSWQDQTVNGRLERVEVAETVVEYAHFLPEELNVAGQVEPSRLHRGIYEAVVYRATLAVSGRFARPSFEEWKVAAEDILWDGATVALTITDLRGAQGPMTLRWGGETFPLEPGSRLADYPGVHARLRDPPIDSDTTPFELSLTLKGSRNLSFAPFGRQNRVQLSSPWPDPSFNGGFLPSTRKVTAQGFEALWEVSYYGRHYPQQWSSHGNPTPVAGNGLEASLFGVAFTPVLDTYRYVERSIKYGILFIALVFAAYFLFEVLSGVRVHPFQYMLVGAALCLFYLVLLSLSEFWQFHTAYATGAAGASLMITLYSGRVLHRLARSLLLGCGLFGVYGFLYVILRQQEYSLLIGTTGLVAALAAVMFATRNVDWYSHKSR